jgi:hypothetical protein
MILIEVKSGSAAQPTPEDGRETARSRKEAWRTSRPTRDVEEGTRRALLSVAQSICQRTSGGNHEPRFSFR